jgi:transposase
MSIAKTIHVKESVKELTLLKRGSSDTVSKRLQMLIVIKRNKEGSLSKRALSKVVGVNANSITAWKKRYEREGISGIISDGRIGFKPSVVSEKEHKEIEKKLKDPKSGIRGYKELLDWVKQELSKDMKYITLVKYAERHFGSKIKLARKGHVKKDEQAVEAFKKTSHKNVRKSP